MLPSFSNDILYSVALSKAKYVGMAIGRYIIDNVASLSEIFAPNVDIKSKLPRLRQNVIRSLQDSKLIDEANNIVRWCEKNEVHIIPINSDYYPKLLKECPDAPLLIYAKGNIDVLNSNDSISIVGTRNITKYGADITNFIVKDLSQAVPTMNIVSGLAFGVDIYAHRMAIEQGLPTTAVLAHGLDRIYPYQHQRDAMNIIDRGGVIISEYSPFTKPERFNFVARNRIIAGMTKGTLVVEAGLKSGSLITAEYAIGYNREVFAIPGKIGDRYSEGCNYLINRMKGVLVTNAEQILYYMGMTVTYNAVVQSINFQDDELPDNPIIKIISEHQPVQLNDIVNISGWDMSKVSSLLFDLELDGFIEAMPGGLYIISKR